MANVVDNDDAKAELARQIVSIVSETFGLQRRVVLLSYLGQALRKNGLDFREILGEQKLAEFIKERLSDQIKIVTTPAGRLILAAVPADVALEKEIDPFGMARKGPVEGSETPAGSHKRELLVRDAWFAFSHALPAGKARVLRLNPTIEYEDYDPESHLKPPGFDVPSDLIVPAGASLTRARRDEVIYDNVKLWADRNGIQFHTLIATPSSGPSRRSALDVLLSSLGESDLARITLPLDLVAKLRRKQQ